MYVDGFVLPVPKKNVKAYRRMAQLGGKIFRKHGALEFRECIGDDLDAKVGRSFKRLANAKPSETVFFSYIVYRSRAHRDRVNARMMKDPAMADMPFNPKRMAYGGFRVLVEA